MCVLGWISKSHARDVSEIQTFGHCGSAGKIEKHVWKSWNLAWCHDMAPTCYGNFSVRFAKAHTLIINKVILELVLSRYKLETQVLLKPWALDLPITCGHVSPFFYWLGGAVRGSYLSTGGVRSDACVCSSGREPFWPLPAMHLPPNVSINGAWAPVLRRGYMSH